MSEAKNALNPPELGLLLSQMTSEQRDLYCQTLLNRQMALSKNGHGNVPPEERLNIARRISDGTLGVAESKGVGSENPHG